MEVNISHNLTRKASVGMYYTYVLITPTTLVCLLFSTAIPTSRFIKHFILVLSILGELSDRLKIPSVTIYSHKSTF